MGAAAKLVSINPSNGQVLGEVESSTTDQLVAAVTAARKAFPAWRALGAEGRVKILQKLFNDFNAHKDELLQLMAKEMGWPIAHAARTFDAPQDRLKWNIENAARLLAPETTMETDKQLHQVHYEPWGVYAVIAPWNSPLSNFSLTALQPLVAGNTVVYKASEEVPLFGKALNESFKRAGVPDGVFGQVFGGPDIGEALMHSDIDHIHFTGSTAVGKKLYQIAAERFLPITLELGGSDAGLVFEDADIDRMIGPIFWEKFLNTGQICSSLKRLFVHESRYEELITKLKAFIATQKIGDPLDKSTAMGPLVSEKQKKLLADQLQDAIGQGAKVLLDERDKLPKQGCYFEPVLLGGVTKQMRAGCEELFGPVLPIATFKTDDEAVRMANDTQYGLSAYIYTQDKGRAKRVASQLQAGSISHNGVGYFQSPNPFGGYKHSGMGRSNGQVGLRTCCQVKTVSTEKI
ncbi:MAG TPA: aldehyde dehydrogenase family protein [Alphaproteobacteria bacterium]|nr:aldehyde dehydrogenase family protein [Alphaproteobacteria bacterium]